MTELDDDLQQLYHYKRGIDECIIRIYGLQKQPSPVASFEISGASGDFCGRRGTWQAKDVLASYKETYESIYEKYPSLDDALLYIYTLWSDHSALEIIEKHERKRRGK